MPHDPTGKKWPHYAWEPFLHEPSPRRKKQIEEAKRPKEKVLIGDNPKETHVYQGKLTGEATTDVPNRRSTFDIKKILKNAGKVVRRVVR